MASINLQKLIRQKNAAKLNQIEEAARAQQQQDNFSGATPRQPNQLELIREQNLGALNLQNMRNQGAMQQQGLQNNGAMQQQQQKGEQDEKLQEMKNSGTLDLQKLMGTQNMSLQGLKGDQDYSLQELKNQGLTDVQRLENEGNELYTGGSEKNAPGTTGPTTMASNLGLEPNSLSQSLMGQTQNAIGRPSINLMELMNKPYGGTPIDLTKINPRLSQGGNLSTSGQAPTAQQLEDELMRKLGY